MANYVKISLLSLSRIWQGMHSQCTGDYEQHTQDMIAYLKEELSNVLPDKPDRYAGSVLTQENPLRTRILLP